MTTAAKGASRVTIVGRDANDATIAETDVDDLVVQIGAGARGVVVGTAVTDDGETPRRDAVLGSVMIKIESALEVVALETEIDIGAAQKRRANRRTIAIRKTEMKKKAENAHEVEVQLSKMDVVNQK